MDFKTNVKKDSALNLHRSFLFISLNSKVPDLSQYFL